MIHLEHPKWRALRVMDQASVDYLNRLFRNGWYVMPFGMDDIDYFVMRVPLETPTLAKYADPFSLGSSSSAPRIAFDVSKSKTVPAITVLVLTQGTKKNRQRAVLNKRNEVGRIDMSQPPGLPNEIWRPVITTLIEEGMLTICESR